MFVDPVEYYMENTTEEIRAEMDLAYERAENFEYLFWYTVYNELPMQQAGAGSIFGTVNVL